MSLRLRLLVAVGLIAIVALVVADFATYSALRSSLYQQVDQSWRHSIPALRIVARSTGNACMLDADAGRVRWRQRRAPDGCPRAAGRGGPNVFGHSATSGT